jgi:hypothetical protein
MVAGTLEQLALRKTHRPASDLSNPCCKDEARTHRSMHGPTTSRHFLELSAILAGRGRLCIPWEVLYAIGVSKQSGMPTAVNSYRGRNSGSWRNREAQGYIDALRLTIPRDERIQHMRGLLGVATTALPVLPIYWDAARCRTA